MNVQELRQLGRLAKVYGVQTSYLNMEGQEQRASTESLMGVLHALGVSLRDPRDAREQLRLAKAASWQSPMEPVVVAWDGRSIRIPLRLPSAVRRSSMQCHLRLETGETRVLNLAMESARAPGTVEGISFVHARLVVPSVPLGYHQIELEIDKSRHETLLIAAPTKSYSSPEAQKQWGFFLPLYAAHSRRSWGAGNFQDWLEFTRWARAQGASLVGSLPLMAAFLDQPQCEPSPYSPASRLFWNEFFIAIESVPEFSRCEAAQRRFASVRFQLRLKNFRAASEIDYGLQMEARRELLELLAEDFFARPTVRYGEWQAFVRQRPEVLDYARFRAAGEAARASWHSWPNRQRNGRLRRGDYQEENQRYHSYVQWIAQQQMQGLVEHGRQSGIKLYLDLPLGVHSDSYDVWRERAHFTLKASAGAPPDTFFTKGQDWGFAPLHPHAIRKQKYRYVLDYLRFQMRHTGLLRIDHVMGLHRLYWIPHGLPAGQGAYVRYPSDELYALLNLESVRHQTVLVGENLGTVPPAVNAGMERHRIRQMYVVQYEQQPTPKQPLRVPPVASVASMNTHDMPTFAGFCRGRDIQDRLELGCITPDQAKREYAARRANLQILKRFLHRRRILKSRKSRLIHLLAGCLEWLGASPAEIVLINVEDLYLEEKPQNVPGTHRERPNWRRKASVAIDDLGQNRRLAKLLARVQQRRSQQSQAVTGDRATPYPNGQVHRTVTKNRATLTR